MSYNALKELDELGRQDLEESLGLPTFNAFGITLPCSISTLSRGTAIDFGGTIVTITFSIIVRTELTKKLPQPLESGKTITFEDVVYRIATARAAATGGHIKLDLIDPNR